MTTQARPKKPLPTPTPDNQPFWDALKQHELRIQQCTDCRHYRWLPKPACPNCMSTNAEWAKVSGEGTVWTFTEIHRSGPAFEEDVPFVAAAIELKEQPLKCLMLSWVVDCKPEDVYIGMPVKVKFEDIPDEDMTLYKFVPV